MDEETVTVTDKFIDKQMKETSLALKNISPKSSIGDDWTPTRYEGVSLPTPPNSLQDLNATDTIPTLPYDVEKRTPDQIVIVKSIGRKDAFDLLAKIMKCVDYPLNYLEFWFIDIIEECMMCAQECQEIANAHIDYMVEYLINFMYGVRNFKLDLDDMFSQFKLDVLQFTGNFEAQSTQDSLKTVTLASNDVSRQRTLSTITQFSKFGSANTNSPRSSFSVLPHQCLTEIFFILEYVYKSFANTFQYNVIKMALEDPPEYFEQDLPYRMEFPKNYLPPDIIDPAVKAAKQLEKSKKKDKGSKKSSKEDSKKGGQKGSKEGSDKGSHKSDKASKKGDKASKKGDKASKKGDKASKKGDKASKKDKKPSKKGDKGGKKEIKANDKLPDGRVLCPPPPPLTPEEEAALEEAIWQEALKKHILPLKLAVPDEFFETLFVKKNDAGKSEASLSKKGKKGKKESKKDKKKKTK